MPRGLDMSQASMLLVYSLLNLTCAKCLEQECRVVRIYPHKGAMLESGKFVDRQMSTQGSVLGAVNSLVHPQKLSAGPFLILCGEAWASASGRGGASIVQAHTAVTGSGGVGEAG